MTTYYSDQFRSDGTPEARKRHHVSPYAVTAKFTIPGVALTTDTIQMIPVQAGTKVKDIILTSPDIDTGTSAEIVVGDTDGTATTNRYITATTDNATAASLMRMNNVAGHNYQFAANGTIDIKVSVAPETGTTTGTYVMTAFLGGDDDLP